MNEPPTYAVDVWKPIRRKWWQWLLRREVQYSYTFIPNAIATPDDRSGRGYTFTYNPNPWGTPPYQRDTQ